MGLLDGGLQAIFGQAFGPRLLDATLHKVTLTDDGTGGFSSASLPYPVKGMIDDYSDYTRAQLGVPQTDVRLIVMQYGVPVEPQLQDELTIRDRRYALSRIKADPANATWTMNGSPK
jgi:hypothetical protein